MATVTVAITETATVPIRLSEPERSFKLPSEAHTTLNKGRFSPNVGLVWRQENLPDPVETLEFANVNLRKYGFGPVSHRDLVATDCISAEVGDDELSLEQSKAAAVLLLYFHQKMGMKVSWEDTSINSRYGNFAEDLVILPDGYGQTYLNTRNTSAFNSMSFLDVPKLRLAIDIRPMRMDHSGTNDGKASMVGSRQRWIPLESPIRGIYEMFNLYQDVNLGLHRDKKFPYMPTSLGGYGKEPPFRNYANFERFAKAFKQGSHTELIREIVHRTLDFLEAEGNNENPATDPLLAHIVRFQSSFHDWVKGKSIYAPVTWFDIPPEVGKHRAAKLGEDPIVDEVVTRLLGERRLLTESQLEIAEEHNQLCKALVSSESINTFKRVRDEARSRWQNLSVFSLENYGMIEEITFSQTRGLLRPLKQIETARFFELINSKRYNLKHLLRSEFVYWPEAMDEIYERGPMNVHFSFLPRNKVGSRSFAAPRSDYKSDHIDTVEIPALDNLCAWLRARNKSVNIRLDRTVINDDNAIVRECSLHAYNIIITDDKKLCRQAAKITRSVIFRVPVVWYYKSLYFGTKHWSEFLQELYPGITWTEHEDSGSIQSFEEGQFKDGVMLSRPSSQKFNFLKTMDMKDVYVYEELLEFSDEPPEGVKALLIDNANVLHTRARRKPTFRRSSQQSWR